MLGQRVYTGKIQSAVWDQDTDGFRISFKAQVGGKKVVLEIVLPREEGLAYLDAKGARVIIEPCIDPEPEDH